MNRNFPAKILLFGEYSILLGSSALASPIKKFHSKWNFSDAPHPSQVHLQAILYYLKRVNCDFLDLRRFEMELKKGLIFDTTIPIGYGAGSSGAVSAALYNRYTLKELTKLPQIRSKLKFIENQFHGNSSGLDPLVSYYRKAILVNEEKELSLIDTPYCKDDYTFFLLDTLKSRTTAPLVKKFKEAIQDEEYLNRIKTELIPDVNLAIQHLLNGEMKALFETTHDIGFFQYKYMREMIPEKFYDPWLKGMSGDTYKLKLCGAGGGGFILGITSNFVKTKRTLRQYKLFPILKPV